MQKKRYLLIIIMFMLLTVSCAGIKFVKITSKNNDNVEGLRFYCPEPYLLVTGTDTTGTDTVPYQCTILWLPNKKDEYSMQLKSGLGSNNMEIKLQNGWLVTEFKDNVDSKIPEMVTAATAPMAGIIGAAKTVPLKGMKQPQAKQQVGPLKPGLYRFTFEENKGYIKGLERINLEN